MNAAAAPNSVAVIGAGITGLTAAFRLRQAGFAPVVFEAASRVGGVIGAVRTDGWLHELGPNSLLEGSAEVAALVDEVGLGSRRLYAADAARQRYIVRAGRMVAMPTSPLAFVTTPLFSLRAKLALLGEPWRAKAPAEVEETVADFVVRRLDREFLDYAINQRGVHVDLSAIQAAIAIVEKEQARLDSAMRKHTGGAVAGCNAVSQLGDWIKWQGVTMDGCNKASIIDALSDDSLPSQVRKALELRREAGKSSTAKLKKMMALAGTDGRLRNQLQYHAASTGRWGGRGAQLQNLPRGNLKPNQVADAIEHLHDETYLDIQYGPPMDVVSSCIRGMIAAAPGHDLISCDYSNIEGRVLAWLAGEEWKLQAFRDFDEGKGPDLYLVAAGRIYGCEPAEAKPHRQIGKVSELALGYQGGVGAFQSMAKIYGVKVPDDQADGIKLKWRSAHPKTVRFWYALEEAAINAIQNPGGIFAAGHKDRPCRFRMVGSFLWCQLPSKRVLCYPYAKTVAGKFGKDAIRYMAVNGVTKKWEATDTYGGSLAENVTQAVARDILANAIFSLEAQEYNVVFHVHDEAVVEIASDDATTPEDISAVMCQLPEWARGLPVVATGWRGARYRKD